MPRRMIDPSIWINESFGELTAHQRLLMIGLISLADDQGRGKANPAYLRAQLFPYDDLTLQEIADGLTAIQENGTIHLYDVGSKSYYQLSKWWTYQSLSFAQPSQWPRPEGWSDRIRINSGKTKIVTCNWITSSGQRLPDTCDESGVVHVDIHMDGHMDGQMELQIRSDQNHDQTHDQTHDQIHDQPESPAGDEMVAFDPDDLDDLTGAKSNIAIRRAWMETIMIPLQPKELARLEGLAKKHGIEETLRAISRAGEFGGQSVSYVAKILESPAPSGGHRRKDRGATTGELTAEELRRKYAPEEYSGIILS